MRRRLVKCDLKNRFSTCILVLAWGECFSSVIGANKHQSGPYYSCTEGHFRLSYVASNKTEIVLHDHQFDTSSQVVRGIYAGHV